jgi:hypothetical protein
MGKLAVIIIGGGGVVALRYLAAPYFDDQWPLDLLVVLAIVWAAVSIGVLYVERGIQRDVRSLHPDLRHALIEQDGELRDVMEAASLVGERIDWRWRTENVVFAVAWLALPPAALILLVTGTLSGNSPFGFPHLVLVASGAWIATRLHRRRVARYQCAACAATVTRIRNDPIRCRCDGCGRVWNLGPEWSRGSGGGLLIWGSVAAAVTGYVIFTYVL